MGSVRVASAQYPITQHSSWEGWESHVQKWISEAVQNKAQILVFPEYGSMELVSLFSEKVQKDLQAQVLEIEKLREKFMAFFGKQAQQHGVAILAPSLPMVDKKFSLPVNRAYFFFPNGQVDFQDKKHMTRFEDESWGVGAGIPEFKTFQVFGASFGVNICFDVEFPQEAHELAKKGVQVLLAPSCTESLKGMNRVHVGARARALENQYYVVVSQTIGEAPWSLSVDANTGKAAVYSTCDVGFPDDGTLAVGELNRPQWVFCDLNLDLIRTVRESGQVFNFKNMS